jgi:hypothetical protein
VSKIEHRDLSTCVSNTPFLQLPFVHNQSWTYYLRHVLIFSHLRAKSSDSTTATIADDTAAIASQKLQTNLLAIQNWFNKWRMKANQSK